MLIKVQHLARATGSTGSAALPYRVDLRTGKHLLVADEPTAAGGGDVGPSPMGLLLSALAACTATTLRLYASRKAWDLTTIEIDVRYTIVADGRGVISRTITVPTELATEQHQRLAEIAERTPVTVAIQDGTPINTTIQQR